MDGPRLDAERRERFGGAFARGGARYEKVRPDYPRQIAQWFLEDLEHSTASAVDVGAGTGKFTQFLIDAACEVSAVDPSADMLAQLTKRFPAVPTYLGTAENTGLASESQDLVTVAQAWHWVEPMAGSRELARILCPGGRLGLVWNQMDTQVPWVKRLSRIMHAGDVIKADFEPVIGPEFARREAIQARWQDSLTPVQIMELTTSRSYYLRASEPVRAKVMANLRWYLLEYLGHQEDERLTLPYITYAWRAHKV